MEFELKKWDLTYLDDFLKATDDPELAENMCENLPYPMDNAFAFEYIKERLLNSEEKQICRAVVIDGHAIGGADVILGSGDFQKSAEISVWLARQYRGKNIGSAVIARICREAFEKFDIVRISAHPLSAHKMVGTALETAGFRHEGTLRKAIFKNGKIYDSEIYAVLRGEI